MNEEYYEVKVKVQDEKKSNARIIHEWIVRMK